MFQIFKKKERKMFYRRRKIHKQKESSNCQQ